MSASNYGPDSMEWLGRGRSSSSPGSSRKGKRATASSSDKPARQPQRGLGVAQLEKIRMQSEMAEYFHHPAPGQPPPPPPPSSIHGAAAAGSPNQLDQDAVLLSSPPTSSSCHGNISVSSSHYPIHPNLQMMANHAAMRYAGSQSAAASTPIVRSSPNYHGACYGAAQYYSHQSNGDITLPLLEPADDFICFNGQRDLNVPVDSSSGSMNSSDDTHDVDLELKL